MIVGNVHPSRQSLCQRQSYGHRTGTSGHHFLDKEKGLARANVLTLIFAGRDGVIRTLDPLHPMQVRYQAALRPDGGIITQVSLLA